MKFTSKSFALITLSTVLLSGCAGIFEMSKEEIKQMSRERAMEQEKQTAQIMDFCSGDPVCMASVFSTEQQAEAMKQQAELARQQMEDESFRQSAEDFQRNADRVSDSFDERMENIRSIGPNRQNIYLHHQY